MGQNKEALTATLEELLEITRMIELMKEKYARYDELVEGLVSQGFQTATLGEHTFTLKDNFAEKNTAFKACGVKRFEVKVTEK